MEHNSGSNSNSISSEEFNKNMLLFDSSSEDSSNKDLIFKLEKDVSQQHINREEINNNPKESSEVKN